MRRVRRRHLVVVTVIAVILACVAAGVAISTLVQRDDEVAGNENQTTSSTQAEESPSSEVSPTSSPPASPSPASATEETTVELTPELTYSVWVDQEDPIPDQIVKNSLSWNVDLCSTDLDMAKKRNSRKIALSLKVDGKWEVQPIPAQTEVGERCGEDKIHITMPVTEPAPSEDLVDTGWGACADYRVELPETQNFAATNVDMCVRTRVDQASEDLS